MSLRLGVACAARNRSSANWLLIVAGFGDLPETRDTGVGATSWGALAAIAFVTLSPLGLRPSFGHVNMERFGAFAVLGLLFGLAYGRHLILVAALLIGSAALLEMLQFVAPGRDPALTNAMYKIAGGIIGVCAAAVLARILPARAPAS